MAFSIQFPNNPNFSHVNYFSKELRKGVTARNDVIQWNRMDADSMYSYYQKITDVSPSLCFQSDVFLPNARAAVQSVTCEISPDTPGRFVMGCKGHQVQSDFSLKPRIPVAVPLVQYPSFKLGVSVEERDICAVPVINWENYMNTLKNSFRGSYGVSSGCSAADTRKPVIVLTEEQKLKLKKHKWEKKYENIPTDEWPPLEDEDSEESESDNEMSDSDNSDNYNTRVSGFKELKRKFFEIDEDLTITPEEKKLRKQRLELERSITGKTTKQKPKSKSQKINGRMESVKLPKKLKNKYKKYEKFIKEGAGLLPVHMIRKFKQLPEIRVEATWNYFYGGSNGACCAVQNRAAVIDVFVGNKTQLRRIQLKESPSSTLSYKVESVWEEEKSSVPSNIRPGRDEPLSDIIFQVVPNKFKLIGVRRGKSVDIYDNSEDIPSLLDTIPNICYGSHNYDGWKQYSAFDVIKDPMLFGLDFNPQFAPEFITIDENRQIRIGDFYKENTISSYRLEKRPRHWPNLVEWPKYQNLNNAAGVCFCRNGHTFISWSDSKVYLGDRRDPMFARTSLTEIFDARGSTSTLSWSDQKFFNDSEMELNEYVSAVTMSERDFYYYVGTTARLMLMDFRVPGQPVFKTSHGLKSAASQLETYTDENFEIVVAASQRVPSSVCVITDHAHAMCASRPNCEGKNPILQCLPRHLSSSSEFFDAVIKSGLTCQSEADYQRSKDQSNAWTTGLAILKSPVNTDPRFPPGIIVLTSNSFGDLYYQELDQKCNLTNTQLGTQDTKFQDFTRQWRASMCSSDLEYLRPSLNRYAPSDNSLIVEACARNIRKMSRIRDKPFNPMIPDDMIHHHVLEHQIDISKQLQDLQVAASDADLTSKFFEVWKEEEFIAPVIKEEVIEGDGNIWNEEEANYDVQVLETASLTKDSRIVDVERDEMSENSSDSEEPKNNMLRPLDGERESSHSDSDPQPDSSESESSSEDDIEELGHSTMKSSSPTKFLGESPSKEEEIEPAMKSEQNLSDGELEVDQLEEEVPFEDSQLDFSGASRDDFERMLLTRLPFPDEETENFSQYEHSVRPTYDDDDPLRFGYHEEHTEYASYISSQHSTESRVSRPKLFKKPSTKRSGF